MSPALWSADRSPSPSLWHDYNKRKFEREFGKLAAFAVIHQRDGEVKRSNAIAAFAAALK
jgi:hypothetical protein